MRRPLLAAAIGALAWTGAPAQTATGEDALAAGFRDPPASARPRAWWHWLNGNVTQDGITKDLEWMKRVGLGGAQTFDASLGTPQVVKDRLAYMTPPWKAAFAHASSEASRLGLELAIASSPGWSETGGPWVAPADAMKKLVWSETEIVGGKRFSGRLAPPPGVTGPYGTAAFADPLAAFEGKDARPMPSARGDIAVLAYPVTAPAPPAPRATDQAGHALDASALTDAREDTSVAIPIGTATAPPAIVLDYGGEQVVRSATLFVPNAVPPFGDPLYLPALEVETAAGWTRVATIPLGNVPTTISFAPVSGQRFRLLFGPNDALKKAGLAPAAPGAVMGGIFPTGPTPTTIAVGTLRLSGEARVDRVEAKAGFATVPDYYALSAGLPELSGVAPDRVIDLTARMRPEGTLDWTPPAGRWRIVRLGWSLLGTTNHPATPEATGLEVDKYDGAAVRRYLTRYLDTYGIAAGGAHVVDALLTDSIESGDANWTPALIERFTALRGYDPRPWLPALTGAVIGSRARSDAFLYDYRRTLADLLAREHYTTIAAIAHERGLKLYGEALEDGRPQLGDDLAMRAHADVPMAAMWAFAKDGAPRPTLIGDILGAASVAHVYGQNLVAAESFTASFSPWAFAPADLRRVADLEFALGVNRPVIHTSVHSPMDDREPGLSLAIFGQYFNRHDTWAEMARPWIDYLARTSFLLQQGRHVADVAYFAGEEAPLTSLYAQGTLAVLPTEHGFDFVDADMLAGPLAVADGDIVAKSGARYRFLYLGGTSRRMTLATLRRIAALVEGGATVAGDAPIASPSLNDDPAAFAALVRTLWAGGAGTRVGRGRVLAGQDLDAAFERMNLAPDFASSVPVGDGDLLFQHRALPDADIYFVSSRSQRPLTFEARFRVTGREPEIWHADSGASERTSWRTEQGRTIVPLTLGPEDSCFVVFRRPASGAAVSVAAVSTMPVERLDGPWQVGFQPGRGAPAAITMPALVPLDTTAQPGIRYFSGVATYRKRFTLPRAATGHGRLLLDLGQVGDVAEVRINGRPVGTVWHTPFRLDIGAAVRPGANELEVRVANLWVNRLIGDAQPGATKLTFTTAPTYQPDAPLRPSGLIGPVTLLSQTDAAPAPGSGDPQSRRTIR